MIKMAGIVKNTRKAPDAIALLIGMRKNFSTLTQVACHALRFAFFELIVRDEFWGYNF
jgi:hypothetical protein